MSDVAITGAGRDYSRGTSIKTRIETFPLPPPFCVTGHSRGTSIKTRIETRFKFFQIFNYPIPEALPLKQGLKLEKQKATKKPKDNSRGTSIKTRIETSWIDQFFSLRWIIPEALPLKQGLKLKLTIHVAMWSWNIPEALPLKQGLKLKK